MSRRKWEVLLSFSGPLVVLGIWEFLSRTGLIDSRFWPAPTSLIDTLTEQVQSGALFTNVRISLVRILVGFLILALVITPIMSTFLDYFVSVMHQLTPLR